MRTAVHKGWERGSILLKGSLKGLADKLSFEQRPERSEGVSQVVG